MTTLLIQAALPHGEPPPPPAPRLRGRRGVKTIINLVPAYEKHDLAWWVAHLTEHWD